MHYKLHYMPVVLAYFITSLATMFMLVALISGIIIHKKIFKDFFTFRAGKKTTRLAGYAQSAQCAATALSFNDYLQRSDFFNVHHPACPYWCLL